MVSQISLVLCLLSLHGGYVQERGRAWLICAGDLRALSGVILVAEWSDSTLLDASQLDRRALRWGEWSKAVGLVTEKVDNSNKVYRVAQKNKPLSNDQKLVLNRIKACEWDKIYSWSMNQEL